MYNNYYNPINAGMNPGQFRQGYYQQPVKPIKKVSSSLSDDEIKFMRNIHQPQVTIKPTDTEIIAGKCNHHYPDSSTALEPLHPETPNDGWFKCQICGTEINFNDCNSQEEADDITVRFVNLQEMVKFSNFSMSPELTAQYYGNTIPYNQKMGLLYRQASLDNGRVESGMYNMRTGNMQGAYVYNTLTNGYAAGANAMPYGAAPVQPGTPVQTYAPYGAPVGQPQPMGQPMGNPLYADSPVSQPYGQPSGYYTPQNAAQGMTDIEAERRKLEEERRAFEEEKRQRAEQQTVRTSQA